MGCLGIIGIIVGAIVLLGILIAIFSGGKDGDTTNNSSTNISDSTQKSSTQKETKPKIEFTNVVLQSQMGFTNVIGEAINNDSKAHSFTLKVSFYDKDKKLIGSATGAVNDLAAGDTKSFTAMATGDYSKADSYKVQVDSMVK